ncbi:Protein kinase domain-containing protein [Nonomuraea solani]|uniref:non-specific serine/threonine protein kinase n=2 Tax=Nonomuraea solani TaxID=1144553 RepID=A0A1H6DGL1_9ACTN|nr:Protein kinase domain-containing protein [Nonomuraea solani]
MGTVWQAHDEVLGRDVAVKEILPPPDLTADEREVFAVRTFREARAAGRVAHPGVAAVYDVLEEGGHPWIVMQFVQSRTLGELIRDEGPMAPMAAANVALQLLEALRAAHAAGVLHRDVKPDNVLLTPDDRAVLTDFGIATTEDEAPVTRTGILVGTPSYMAPERAAGGRASPASDLWSVGVTLYMAVEGHSPFHRDHALATLGAVMHAEPEPLARAGVLAPVVHGLLRKNPAERMSLAEAERRLSMILAGGAPEQTGPVAAVAAAPAVPARRRMVPMAAIAGGALLVAVVTGGAAWWSQRPLDLPREPGNSVPVVVNTTPTPETSPSEEERQQPVSPRNTPQTTPQNTPRNTPSAERSSTPERSPSGRSSPTRRQPTPTKSKATKETKTDEAPGPTPGQVDGTEDD